MTKFKLAIGNEVREYTASRQDDEIVLDDGVNTAVFQLIHADNQTYSLTWIQANGVRKKIELAGFKDKDSRQLWVNGRTFKAKQVRERGSENASVDGSLSASIPAVVSQILVKIGDNVETGDKLILLESMKMIIPIQAPYSGSVTALHCAVGESIQANTQLIELVKN